MIQCQLLSCIHCFVGAVPPNVTAWPESVEVNILRSDRSVTFICEAFGNPVPQVRLRTTYSIYI